MRAVTRECDCASNLRDGRVAFVELPGEIANCLLEGLESLGGGCLVVGHGREECWFEGLEGLLEGGEGCAEVGCLAVR